MTENYPSKLVSNGNDAEMLLEQQCLFGILQNIMASVMLDDADEEGTGERDKWHAVFYNFIKKGDPNSDSGGGGAVARGGQIATLHDAIQPFIGPRVTPPELDKSETERAEEEAISALFSMASLSSGPSMLQPEGGEGGATTPSPLSALPAPLFPFIGCDEALSTGELGLPPPIPLGGPALEALQSELIWLGPQYPTLRLALMSPDDEQMTMNESSKLASKAGTESLDAEVVDIMKNRAFVIPLPPQDERKVLSALTGEDIAENEGKKAVNGPSKKGKKGKSGSKRSHQNVALTGHAQWERRALRLVVESGLTPQNLPRLVDKNPLVAVESLILILTSPNGGVDGGNAHDKSEFLSALAGMDMTIHSMEVVNRLATHSAARGEGDAQPLLHREYIHLYISTCISSCEDMSCDRHLQNKSVRLFCVLAEPYQERHC